MKRLSRCAVAFTLASACDTAAPTQPVEHQHLLSTFSSSPASVAVRLTDLGVIGGGGVSTGRDINDVGQIAVWAASWDGSSAYRWTPGIGAVQLPFEGQGSYAWDINNRGEVAGQGIVAVELDIIDRALLWSRDDTPMNLGSLGGTFSRALANNNAGHAVGESQTSAGEGHAFLWTPQLGMRDLGTLGGTTSVATDINDRGAVVGRAETASGNLHAFVWTRKRGMIDLGTLGGAYSSATAINNRGVIIGSSETAAGAYHVFMWTRELGMQDLGSIGGEQSFATDISDRGEIVGLARNSEGQFAWLLSPRFGFIELPGLTPTATSALGINNRGEVTGWGIAEVFADGSFEGHTLHWRVGSRRQRRKMARNETATALVRYATQAAELFAARSSADGIAASSATQRAHDRFRRILDGVIDEASR